jgi:Transposase DDE domain
MAEHSSLSHDKITRFLSSNPMSEHHFYEQIYFDKPLYSGGYLIFDDTVLDKSHSNQIEMVRKQYSGNVGGLVRGIGIVNMLYYTPRDERWYLLGYRVFDPDIDNKSKVEHVLDLIKEAENQCVAYIGVLMDTWYAISSLFQLINSYGKYFYCPIKNNRLVKQITDTDFVSVCDLSWNKNQLQFGQNIKVKNLNLNVRIFKVTVSTNRTDFVLTNDLSNHSTQMITSKQKIRWKIECLHRELKQLTGIAKCQCRKALSQRTHIFCAMLVWNKIKEMAYQTCSTAYQIKNQPFKIYLTQQLKMCCPVFA